MPIIDITTEIHAPRQRVFDLSRSIEMHIASTAHTGERAIAGVTSGLMNLEDEVTWRARHVGIWQQLASRITMFDPPHHFRDSLVRGVFRRLDHDHFFSERGDITLIRDVFDYVSPLGLIGRLADVLYLTHYIIIYMERLLLARNALIKTVAETDEWQAYLAET